MENVNQPWRKTWLITNLREHGVAIITLDELEQGKRWGSWDKRVFSLSKSVDIEQ